MASNSTPRFTRADHYAIAVARFAADTKTEPYQVVRLVALARKAFRAGERACNVPDTGAAYDRASARFEALAAELGFGVTWPGLWPTLTRDGRDVYLPSGR